VSANVTVGDARGDARHRESSAPPRLGLRLSESDLPGDAVEHAGRAEALGVTEVWLSEPGDVRDGNVLAPHVVSSTTQVVVALDMGDRFVRHPSAIAMEALKLHEAAPGRVRLRFGELFSTRAPDDASLTEMADGIAAVRSRLVDAPAILIFVGAVTARALYLAGAHADGVELGPLATPAYIEWARQEVARGASDHGRDPESIDLVTQVIVSVDHNAGRARDDVLDLLAYWFHRADWSVIERSGADLERIAAVRRSVERYGTTAALPLLTNDLVHTFAAVGGPEHVIQQLDHYVQAGVRGVLAVPALRRGAGIELLADRVWPYVGATPRVTAT
jgi:alkanesulfonate monooxygenase SsuD/methylene tetrahydromethanopterin reductase-like flavin-dependent oxidoreductase (luciferase family)